MTTYRAGKLLSNFSRWAKTEAVTADLDEAWRVLHIHRETLRRASPGDWRIDDIGRLLLDIYPRRHPHEFGPPNTVADTLRALLDYLQLSGRLRKGREQHTLLIAELDRVEHMYPGTLARLGEFPTQQQPPPHRFVIEPDPWTELPMILAKSSPLLSGAIELSEWVGNQRPTLESGELDIAGAAAAIADLGLGPVPDSVQHPNCFLPLRKRWLLARALGLIRVSDEGCTASTNIRVWLRDDPENVLNIWCDAFEVVRSGRLHPEVERETPMFELIRASVAIIMILSRLETGSITESDVDQVIAALLERHDPAARKSGARTIHRVCTTFLDELIELGAIVRDGGTLTLTDLGRLARDRQDERDEMETEDDDDDDIEWYPPASKAS